MLLAKGCELRFQLSTRVIHMCVMCVMGVMGVMGVRRTPRSAWLEVAQSISQYDVIQ